MKVDLQSSRAKLESACQNISSLKSRIKSKKHSIHWLWRERDGCIDELEMECGRYRATLERLTLANAELASARAEVESAREALNQAIENFRNSKEFKEKIFEGEFALYCIGYEDDRDVIKKLYPVLDLSSIIPLMGFSDVAEYIFQNF